MDGDARYDGGGWSAGSAGDSILMSHDTVRHNETH